MEKLHYYPKVKQTEYKNLNYYHPKVEGTKEVIPEGQWGKMAKMT